MKKVFAATLILVMSLSVVAAASSLEIGVKMNTDLDVASFADFYLTENFSLGGSLAVGEVNNEQTPSLSIKHVQVSGRYHAPSVHSPVSFFGGGGLRLGINQGPEQGDENDEGGGLQTVLHVGARLNSAFGLNLIGEFSLVSDISDLTNYKLEPWFGLSFRF